MTDLLEEAVATARGLSPDMQNEAMRVVLAFGDDRGLYRFTREEAAELDEAAAAARGAFATDEAVRAIWAKHGL